MVQPIADALLEQSTDVADRRIPEVATNHIASQGQGQAGPLLPPDAEIHDQVQALLLKSQLPFVDDQASLESAVLDNLENLIEWDHLVGESFGNQQAQG